METILETIAQIWGYFGTIIGWACVIQYCKARNNTEKDNSGMTASAMKFAWILLLGYVNLLYFYIPDTSIYNYIMDYDIEINIITIAIDLIVVIPAVFMILLSINAIFFTKYADENNNKDNS